MQREVVQTGIAEGLGDGGQPRHRLCLEGGRAPRRAERIAHQAQRAAAFGDQRIAVGQQRQGERVRHAFRDHVDAQLVLLGGIEDIARLVERDRCDAGRWRLGSGSARGTRHEKTERCEGRAMRPE